MLTLADVQAAAERLAPYLQETLTVRSRLLSERLGCDVYLKQENLQGIISLQSSLGSVAAVGGPTHGASSRASAATGPRVVVAPRRRIGGG